MTSRQSRLRQSSGSEAVADIFIHNPQSTARQDMLRRVWIVDFLLSEKWRDFVKMA